MWPWSEIRRLDKIREELIDKQADHLLRLALAEQALRTAERELEQLRISHIRALIRDDRERTQLENRNVLLARTIETIQQENRTWLAAEKRRKDKFHARVTRKAAKI